MLDAKSPSEDHVSIQATLKTNLVFVKKILKIGSQKKRSYWMSTR